jgi:hypothetical protein
MERGELPRQHALIESSVAGAQHRTAAAGELQRDTQPRRPDVPRVQRAQTAHHVIGLLSLRVEHRQILTDGAAVIETHAGVDRQTIAHGDRVAHEAGGGDGHTARNGWIARHGLKRVAVVVDEPHPGRNDRRQMVLAFFQLTADSPLMIGAE